jgi:hypothetical protein
MVLERTLLIACATVIEEVTDLMPSSMDSIVLDFGLHLNPDNLKSRLQQEIDAAGDRYSAIVLGYGLCSMAVVGLRANHCRLVVPRVDDCIAIFLGSAAAYKAQAQKEPGTYYLTKGWIEVDDTLLKEYQRLIGQYGQDRAEQIMGIMLNHYTRLAYIDTGHQDQQRYRDYARRAAKLLKLRFEEIPGSNTLVRKMVTGQWDEDFVIADPGQTLTYADFKLPHNS